jgi:release factor glutamine methyltransferase
MLIGETTKNPNIDQVELEIFLAHLLKKDRSFIKAFPEFKLNKRQEAAFNDFLKRRSKHEPLAYILGFREFLNLNFKVDKRAMIPRTETEDLVTEVIKFIYSIPKRKPNSNASLTIADVGTGSGNIAISLAKAVPFSRIIAIDKDSDALELAEENIHKHKVKRQVKILQGDLLTPLQTMVDIIVANLPYVPTSRLKTLEPEVRIWEPRVALDGGKDGFDWYRKLLKQAPKFLRFGGRIFYELDGETYQRTF